MRSQVQITVPANIYTPLKFLQSTIFFGIVHNLVTTFCTVKATGQLQIKGVAHTGARVGQREGFRNCTGLVGTEHGTDYDGFNY